MRDAQRGRPQLQDAVARAVEKTIELDQDVDTVVMDALRCLAVVERLE